MDFKGCKVALIGMAATGVAAARVLVRRGAEVTVHDPKAEAELLEPVAALREIGAGWRVGAAAYEGIDAADLVVPSPGVPMEAPVLVEARRRGTPVLAEIEIAGRIAAAPLLCVTGTNGKTTTVLMLAQMLRADGRDVQVAGNTLAGGYQVPLIQAADTTPASGWIVAEISSFQLEWVAGFRPKVAVVTNVTADHLNRHGTRDAYLAAKARLVESQGPEDWAVFNAHDPGSMAIAASARARRLFFHRTEPVEAGAWTTERDGQGRWILARLPEPSVPPSPVSGLPSPVPRPPSPVDVAPVDALRVPGEHNVENALAATAAALAVGVRPASIATALREFTGVPDRLERIAERNGVEYVNNTMCTNVDAAVRSIEAFDRPVVLIAGGKDKGSDFAPLGDAIARRVKALVTIGADGDKIAECARAAGFRRITAAGSMPEAVEQAAAAAAPGDVVLLAPACASFDWYRSFEERGQAFKHAVAQLTS
jgi:UDP-N-acetylmuramoylalanine--D-glutamate ligase